jgi:putative membrane protein
MMQAIAPLGRERRADLFALLVAILTTTWVPGTGPALAQTASDRAFLAWAIQIEIQQQDMGRIAEERARTDRVRQLGSYLVARHLQAQRRLEELDRQLGITLSDKLSQTHLQVQSRFRSIASAHFDGAFIRHEVNDYRYFLAHFEAAAHSGTPSVRQYAVSEIANLRQDQARIATLADGEP